MRKDIIFMSRGLRCQGWFYVPEGLAEGDRRPVVIMTHGLTAVKEMILPNFAEAFASAGFAVLAFDYRCFGESEGEPRSQLFPLDQVEDARNAITWAADQAEVDQRIALWGTSLAVRCSLHSYVRQAGEGCCCSSPVHNHP
jgi:dipeptidyl aminopeptidase/acylaminoacyl peptidase